MKMKNFKDSLKMLESLVKKLFNTKIKQLCYLNKFKDLILLLDPKIIKLMSLDITQDNLMVWVQLLTLYKIELRNLLDKINN